MKARPACADWHEIGVNEHQLHNGLAVSGGFVLIEAAHDLMGLDHRHRARNRGTLGSPEVLKRGCRAAMRDLDGVPTVHNGREVTIGNAHNQALDSEPCSFVMPTIADSVMSLSP